MKPSTALVISLGINAVLIAVALGLVRRPASSGTVAPAAESPAIAAPSQVAATATDPAKIAGSNILVTNHPAWRRIESPDWEELAANLRAAGCPERSVRDIITARARRAERGLESEPAPDPGFWVAGVKAKRASREQAQRRHAASEELRARLQQALGPDADIHEARWRKDLVEQAVFRFFFGPMPEHTLERILSASERFKARAEEIKARAGGVLLDADVAALARLNPALRQEITGALTPSQLEEMLARTGFMSSLDNARVEATDLTPDELRQIGRISARENDPLLEMFDLSTEESPDAEQRAAAAVREFLGAERYAHFERAKDGEFRALFDVGTENNLPRDAAVAAYEVRKFAAEKMKEWRGDKSLGAQERQRRIRQLQDEVQQAALEALGEKARGDYLKRGGAWITNLNSL